MRLIDVVTSPWALMPDKLLEIRAIYETHLRGEKIDIKAVEARIGQSLANEPRPYQVMGNVAVVPMVGVLAKRANMFMQISGGTSTQVVGDWLNQAAADPQVSAIVLEVDSPGGQVDGVQQLAQQVEQIRATGKPVVAWINGMGASGGYWVASAAERVLIADRNTVVGSIGVVSTHVDVSRREEQLGIRTTEITAGKYKRIATGYAPLTEEGRATIQQQVDAIYTNFVEDVAANRGASVEDVLNRMADGRVFIGQAALDAGLVDGVSTLDALVAELQPRSGVGRKSPTSQLNKEATMNREQLKADHADLYEAVRKEGFDAGLKQGVNEGAQVERTRIAAIDAAAVPGHDALTAQAKAEGWDAGRYAVSVLAAEKVERATLLKAHEADAPKPVKDPAPADKASQMSRADFQRLSPAAQASTARSGIRIVD